MSRLPRHLEHLKTGFTAEAVAAATFRAFAEQAAADERPNLAALWRSLAEEKDRLAITLLRAAGRVGDEGRNLQSALAEEQYENEVLYPRLLAEMEVLGREEELSVLREVTARQAEHLAALWRLRQELAAAGGDVATTAFTPEADA